MTLLTKTYSATRVVWFTYKWLIWVNPYNEPFKKTHGQEFELVESLWINSLNQSRYEWMLFNWTNLYRFTDNNMFLWWPHSCWDHCVRGSVNKPYLALVHYRQNAVQGLSASKLCSQCDRKPNWCDASLWHYKMALWHYKMAFLCQPQLAFSSLLVKQDHIFPPNHLPNLFCYMSRKNSARRSSEWLYLRRETC